MILYYHPRFDILGTSVTLNTKLIRLEEGFFMVRTHEWVIVGHI